MSYKLRDIDQLVGKTIASYTFETYLVTLTCADSSRYEITLQDDGEGGNDSHASFTGCDLTPILNRPIVEAWAESPPYDGANLMLKTSESDGFIAITHESNGYYGFSYEVVPVPPSL